MFDTPSGAESGHTPCSISPCVRPPCTQPPTPSVYLPPRTPHRDSAVALGDDLPAGRTATGAEVTRDDRRGSRQTAPTGPVGASVVEDDMAAARDVGMPLRPVQLTACL